MSVADSKKTRKRALSAEAKRSSLSIWEHLEQRRVSGVALDADGLTTNQLLNVVPNLPDSTVYSHLKRLEEYGCVTGERKIIPSATPLMKPSRQNVWKSTGLRPPADVFGEEKASSTCPTTALLGTWVNGSVNIDEIPVVSSQVFDENHHALRLREYRWSMLTPEQQARESAEVSSS